MSPKPDPVDLAVFQSAVHSIAEEMGAALRRTALSPNIKERRDYSCAVFDGRGRVIAMGDHMPVHLGSMPMSVQAAVEAIELRPRRHRDPQRSLRRRNASARHHHGAARVCCADTTGQPSMWRIAPTTPTSAAPSPAPWGRRAKSFRKAFASLRCASCGGRAVTAKSST